MQESQAHRQTAVETESDRERQRVTDSRESDRETEIESDRVQFRQAGAHTQL